MAYKTFKIELSKEDEKFLYDRKKKQGITIAWQLSEAVKMYIKKVKEVQNANN